MVLERFAEYYYAGLASFEVGNWRPLAALTVQSLDHAGYRSGFSDRLHISPFSPSLRLLLRS